MLPSVHIFTYESLLYKQMLLPATAIKLQVYYCNIHFFVVVSIAALLLLPHKLKLCAQVHNTVTAAGVLQYALPDGALKRSAQHQTRGENALPLYIL